MEQDAIKIWKAKNTKFFPVATMSATLTQVAKICQLHTPAVTINHYSRMLTIKIAALSENGLRDLINSINFKPTTVLYGNMITVTKVS